MKPDNETNQPASQPARDDTAPGTDETADWQTSVQKLYDRKTQERRGVSEGDPQRYRQVAAEISARQVKGDLLGSSFNDVILGDGLIDDSTPIVGGEYAQLPLPSPRGDYPYWRQITGTTFLEHTIVKGDLATQRVDCVFAQVAWEILQQFGVEAAYVFLLITTRLKKANAPWEEIVELSTDDLLQLNIWEWEQDLHLGNRLRLAGNWFELVCNLSLLISQIDRKTARFTALRIPFWVLEEMEYGGTVTNAISGYQPEEAQELTIRVGLGLWTEQFADVADNEKQASLLRFGHQAETILQIDPTRKPLTAKLAILMLLLDRLAPQSTQFYAVGAILERLESKAFVIKMHRRKDWRNSGFSRWNTSLHSLQKLGWTIDFSPESYPADLQPAWNHPDGSQSSLDSDNEHWLDLWLAAKIRITPPQLMCPLPPPVELPLTERFTGRNLAQALEIKGLSRSKLAEHLQLDRSMVTYWIKGKRLIQPRHREQIFELLGDELAQAVLN